jgi:Fic family protein
MSYVPGTYEQSLQGHEVYVPDPLPPPLSLPNEVDKEVEEATHLLGQVEMCRTLLPNADLLTYGSLRREALASSTIEGTVASPDELVRFEVSKFSEREAVREVANYAQALEWGVQQIGALPVIASRLILGLHERLMAGVRGASSAGRFKEQQNWIGAYPKAPIEEATFVPCAPEDTVNLVGMLERYINLDNHESKLVQCALVHYQFETIHPFGDGNGRVGRLLIVLQLIQLGLLSAPLIYPSVYFERNRDKYYELLQNVRERGEWDEWIAFFTQGVREQCFETINLTKAILQLRHELPQTIGNVRRRASLSAVVDAFFYHPTLPIQKIQDRANIASYHTVRNALDDLEARGIVYEITGRQRGRVYACIPVLDAIFGRTPTPAAQAGDTRSASA